MLNRLRRHWRVLGAGGALIIAAAGSVAIAADDVMWGVATLLLLVVIGALTAVVLRELRRTARMQKKVLDQTKKTAEQTKKFEAIGAERIGALRNSFDTSARRMAEIVRALEPLRAQIAASGTVANRMDVVLNEGLATAPALRHLEEIVRRSSRDTTAQLEAYDYLTTLVQPPVLLPATRGWAASPDYLALLVETVLAERPQLVVDLGSGLTTIWTALAIRAHGLDTRIVALDHDAHYIGLTHQVLQRCDVADIVEIRHAPLETDQSDGLTWYSSAALEGLTNIDLLSIDGPPGSGTMARFPALPRLADHLAETCTILLDDAHRPDERAAVKQWLADDPRLTASDRFFEKGVVVMRRLPA